MRSKPIHLLLNHHIALDLTPFSLCLAIFLQVKIQSTQMTLQDCFGLAVQ